MASDTALRACAIATLGSTAGGAAEVPAEVAQGDMGEEAAVNGPGELATVSDAGEAGACVAPSADGRVRGGRVAEAEVEGIDDAVAVGRESAPLWISLKISAIVCGEIFAAVNASMRLKEGGLGEQEGE